MKIFLSLVFFLLSSCATVHRNSSSSTNEQQRIDTSSQEHQYQKETTIEERSTANITTNADSVETSGSVSAEDTTTYQQTVETDDMSLTTTMKPKIKNGKVAGYDINSKAKTKPKTVSFPIDKKTTIKETGSDKKQTGITDTKKEVVATSSKSVFRFNFSGVAAIVGVITVILLFLYFGGTFKKKNDEK